jgi:hypothetical protein
MSRPRSGFARVFLALALASCISPEELRREDEATCSGYGFHPGTDAFATCPQQESLARLYSGPPPNPYWDGVFGGCGLGAVMGSARGSDPRSLIRIPLTFSAGYHPRIGPTPKQAPSDRSLVRFRSRSAL